MTGPRSLAANVTVTPHRACSPRSAYSPHRSRRPRASPSSRTIPSGRRRSSARRRSGSLTVRNRHALLRCRSSRPKLDSSRRTGVLPMPNHDGARRARLVVSLPVALTLAAAADADTVLDEIVVTASRMHAPLTVITDPKAPRQPLPAHDGADYLKTIPGFSVIRKGGTDGDPVFRGMAASRVNILLDGEQALGGCGMRMDPPTAYVFPEAYDRIVVVKGPQTVLHGPGNSAASVSFERDVRRFEQPGYEAYASALGASAGRNDLVGD